MKVDREIILLNDSRYDNHAHVVYYCFMSSDFERLTYYVSDCVVISHKIAYLSKYEEGHCLLVKYLLNIFRSVNMKISLEAKYNYSFTLINI